MARTVVVTGGTGGLGAAVTRAFLDEGWRVVVPWLFDQELERVEEHGRLELVQADLMDPGAAGEVVAAAGDDLRALVNLVGGFAAGGRVHETPIDDFEKQLRLNVRPAYLMCAAALPRLLAAGGGASVCVSSGYITGKAAVLAFVDALNAEYRDDGVRANAILPSTIDTPANRRSMPDADFDTWVKPDEIARVVRFLCGDDAAVTSGGHIPVYGRA
jgi:NAD(P)-dependent dehydrogenase (short-subunit alcohol dehydrogenase family)